MKYEYSSGDFEFYKVDWDKEAEVEKVKKILEKRNISISGEKVSVFFEIGKRMKQDYLNESISYLCFKSGNLYDFVVVEDWRDGKLVERAKPDSQKAMAAEVDSEGYKTFVSTHQNLNSSYVEVVESFGKVNVRRFS